MNTTLEISENSKTYPDSIPLLEIGSAFEFNPLLDGNQGENRDHRHTLQITASNDWEAIQA